GEESRRTVHELRGRMDAIIVGGGTLRADDPLLTARPAGPRIATRIVLSASGNLPDNCRLRSTAREAPVLIFTQEEHQTKLTGWVADGCEVVPLPASETGLSIDGVLGELGRRRMTNVMVEGGAGILGAFIDARAADECHIFIAPKIIGGDGALSPIGGRGIERIAQSLSLVNIAVNRGGDDVYIHGIQVDEPRMPPRG
ncbi:MAG TPA: RibD family protein, partial [Urbifossiella sp.]